MARNKVKRDTHLANENPPPGFPGYRTRPGRTGYDPLDTHREAAFMEGMFYRNVFTLRLRTRKVVYLILMFIFGVIPFVPLLFLTIQQVSELFQYGDTAGLVDLFYLSIFTLLTGAITINFLLSILEIAKVIPPLRTSKLPPPKAVALG